MNDIRCKANNRISKLDRKVFHYPGVPQLYPFVNNSINKSWYALRITYSRELAFKEYLDSRGVRNFLPMRYEYVFRGERKIRKLVPVVHNLVFVYATRSEVDEMKSTVGASLPIRYIMDRETRQPITIPEVQMRSFIAVAGNYDEQVVYLDPSVVSMKKGDRVRVTGGIFEGVEGEFVRIKGDRRVVVSIQGVMAVATAFIHPSLIELIKN